VDRAVRATC
jgi:Protein of unknown function (DUF4446)